MNLGWSLVLAALTNSPSSFQNVKRYFLSDHRGHQRIWLDGNPLIEAGFHPSARYQRDSAPDGSIVLTLDDAGAYAVSKKDRSGKTIPVIDINNSQVDSLLKGALAIEVTFKDRQIVISRSGLDRRILDRETRFLESLKTATPLVAGSLYHGAGILDSALHSGLDQSGAQSNVKIAVEIEDEYLELSKRNNSFWAPGAWAVASPMELTLNSRLQGGLPLDVLTMGIPCTGASRAGLAKNHLENPEDHKSAGSQFFYALEWIRSTNPSFVLVENVPDYERSASWSVMRAVLDNLGYNIQTRVFSGADFGALEARQRFVAMAISKGVAKVLDFRLDLVSSSLVKPPTLAAVLEDISPDSDLWRPYEYLLAKEKRDIQDGKGFRLQWLDPQVADHVGTIGRGYWKSRGTEPFIRHPSNPDLARLLTPIEHARVKTIPEFLINGAPSSTTAHEVLGQSVIYEVFRCLGQGLGQQIQNARNALARLEQARVTTALPPKQNDLSW